MGNKMASGEQNIQARIGAACTTFPHTTEHDTASDFPHCQGVKKLVNHEYSYRLRAGNYRVFFEFDGDAHIINIEEVKKRDESTY